MSVFSTRSINTTNEFIDEYVKSASVDDGNVSLSVYDNGAINILTFGTDGTDTDLANSVTANTTTCVNLTNSVNSIDTRTTNLESVDPITNVSWHTSDGVYDRFVFQASQQVHTIKLGEGLSKTISDDLKTTTISATSTGGSVDLTAIEADIISNTGNISNLTNTVNTNTGNILTNTTACSNLTNTVNTNTGNILTNTTACSNLTTSVNENTGDITTLRTDVDDISGNIHELNQGIYSSVLQNGNEIAFNQKTGGATWMTLQFGDNLTVTDIDDGGVFGTKVKIDATATSDQSSSSVSNISLQGLTEVSTSTNGQIAINQDDSKVIEFKDGVNLNRETTNLFASADIIGVRHLGEGGTHTNGVVTGAVSQNIIISNENNVLPNSQVIDDDSIQATLAFDPVNGSFFATVMFNNSATDTNYTVNLTDNTTQTVTSVYQKMVNQVYINVKKPDGSTFDLNDEIDFSIEIITTDPTSNLYSIGLSDGVPFSVEHNDLQSNNGHIINLKDKSNNTILSFFTSEAISNGNEIQQTQNSNFGNNTYTGSSGITLTDDDFGLTDPVFKGVQIEGDNLKFTTTANSNGLESTVLLLGALNKYTREQTDLQFYSKSQVDTLMNTTAIETDISTNTSNISSIDTRVGNLESVDPITNVSWHTSNGVYDRLVFQASEQVHTLKFDGFSKSISADMKTTTIGMPLTSDYTILADELPGTVNGRDVSVYRQIFPKFKSDEFTVILKFGIIDQIDGNSAYNAGNHAPFFLISNDNETTATLNQILMVRRASNRKDFLQIFVHAENTRLGSNTINSYQDVSISNMGTGGTHYITCSFGNGNFEFNFMECNNGIVTVGESYSRGSMTLNYRQREPYHLTINSDIADTGGMGVDYQRFDFFSTYKTENEIKAFIAEIDLL